MLAEGGPHYLLERIVGYDCRKTNNYLEMFATVQPHGLSGFCTGLDQDEYSNAHLLICGRLSLWMVDRRPEP